MKAILLSICLFITILPLTAQESSLPIRGLCVGAPNAKSVDRFVKFIDEELAAIEVNVLVLRVNYNYQYKSHPELQDDGALSASDVKKMVAVCRKNNIELIPMINLLGHQSWHGHASALLRVYPQFDETPEVVLPEKYEWPNDDGLYCKSYCPLHPDVHKVVFELVDEIMEVFEAKKFHAGMDEVFYIGEDQCPRCSGMDKAELFADEVNTINNHLAQQGHELWIWGDRLIDGKTTGLGMWEASMNNTHRAIDMISKDVLICDWHYERPDPTAVIFALKGLRVVTCPWKDGDNARQQLELMLALRENATSEVRDNYQGMLQTVWTSSEQFMDDYYGEADNQDAFGNGQVDCFIQLFEAINQIE